MDANPNHILIFLSGVVIFSYILDRVTRRINIPSVVLLIFCGIGLGALTRSLDIQVPALGNILPVLGSVGLILIVLEGALEIRFQKTGGKMIGKALAAAIIGLSVSIALVTYLLMFTTNAPFMLCFQNAVPLGVISSAVAIPSVSRLLKSKKEFVIYESSFSDILGVIVFNFAINNEQITGASFGHLATELSLVTFFCFVVCALVLLLLRYIKHPIKFFLLIAILIFCYGVGKEFHLSSLIIALALGLFLKNADKIPNAYFRKYFLYDKLHSDLHGFWSLTAESAFLMRTFFFMVFGFTINLNGLTDPIVWTVGGIILVGIYLSRYLMLKWLLRIPHWPELFIAPRGLISILLFLSLPTDKQMPEVADGLLLFLVLSSCIFLALGLIFHRREKEGSITLIEKE